MSGGRAPLRCLELLILAAVPAAALAQPLVRAADVRVAFASPSACAVELAVSATGASSVEHRLDLGEAASVELDGVDGATLDGPPRPIGRTSALLLRNPGARYVVRYHVTNTRAYRCPVWLPTTAAAGQERAMRIAVRLPAGAVPGGTMPSLAWSGQEGVATLAHLPAFVHVPFELSGRTAPWDIARVMDLTSLAVLAASTAAWGYRERRRRQRA